MTLHRFSYSAVLAIAAMGVAGCGADGDGGAAQPTDESWVFGIYMAADNNLDRAATNDINEILRAGVPENSSALILVDRAELGEYGGFGDIPGLQPHSTAKWLRITGTTVEELEDLGEIDTADPDTVRMFVDRLAAEDADRRVAVFWDHGNSFTFGTDDSAPLPFRAMDIADIAAQFRNDPADENSGYREIDIVGFDACLMSSLEALREFKPVAPLFVASAELEPGDGWDYQGVFDFLGNNPALTPEDLATAIVQSYGNYYADSPGRAGGLQVTQAAWLTDTSAVEAAIDALAAAYEAASVNEAGNYNMIAELFAAQAESTFYNRRTDSPVERTSWLDTGQFLANHTEAGGAAIAAAAEDVRQALLGIRIANRADGRDEEVLGLSVYFPLNLIGRNTGTADSGAPRSRLLDGGYGTIQALFDASDPSSAVGALQATDAEPPTLEIIGTVAVPEDVTTTFRAADDVLLVEGDAVLLFRTDDDAELAVAGSSNDAIGVADLSGAVTLPRRAVLLGPDGVTPSAGSVGYLSRDGDNYLVPIVAEKDGRQERGVLILDAEGSAIGAGVVRENGTWSVFPWEEAVAIPGVTVSPLSFTVNLETGDYETDQGDATPIADLTVSFVELDAFEDAERLTVALAVTDVAGNTTITSASLF